MAPTTLVPASVEHDHCYTNAAAPVRQHPDHASRQDPTKETSFLKEIETDCFCYIGEELRSQGFSEAAIGHIINAWRNSTKTQYHVYFRKWIHFCQQQTYNPFQFNKEAVLNFLMELFNNGLNTSGIGTAKSAVHTILGKSRERIDTSFLESLLLKGVFKDVRAKGQKTPITICMFCL